MSCLVKRQFALHDQGRFYNIWAKFAREGLKFANKCCREQIRSISTSGEFNLLLPEKYF
jgi:hypothetical protein